MLFPYPRRAGYWILLEPLSILLIWLLVSVANRFSALAIDRGNSDLGVAVGPFLAGAGILGFAITWSSQTLMKKDVIMRVLILLEDQVAVGDGIMIGEMGGFVENMNLRITQLRDFSGELITISNSMITSVSNLSKDWARVDLSVPLPYNNDMPKAMQLMQKTAETMCQDPKWKELILDAPQLLGIDAFNESGFVVRLWIQTQPLKQWDVERELRRRPKLAMDDQGIAIGISQQAVWLRRTEHHGERIHA
jgi:small-conductance mechanosensitive channel